MCIGAAIRAPLLIPRFPKFIKSFCRNVAVATLFGPIRPTTFVFYFLPIQMKDTEGFLTFVIAAITKQVASHSGLFRCNTTG
jgi:hypothetical protein